MAIKNLHTYANITEKNIETQYTFKTDPHYETSIAYKIVYTTEYDLVLFGKVFHKVKSEEVPFLFKTLDMAKDFCGIKPDYHIYNFKNGRLNNSVQYNTYELSKNQEIIGYVWWDGNSVLTLDNNAHMKFDFDKQPIVYGFVKNIWLDDWEHTHGLRNVKYYGFNELVSKLVLTKTEESEERKWRFELIEK